MVRRNHQPTATWKKETPIGGEKQEKKQNQIVWDDNGCRTHKPRWWRKERSDGKNLNVTSNSTNARSGGKARRRLLPPTGNLTEKKTTTEREEKEFPLLQGERGPISSKQHVTEDEGAS